LIGGMLLAPSLNLNILLLTGNLQEVQLQTAFWAEVHPISETSGKYKLGLGFIPYADSSFAIDIDIL